MLSGATVRGEGGVAGEGTLVGVPKFHSWGKCTVPLTNIQSGWMSNTSSDLCINFFIYTSITAPQDAHTRLVYLGSNALDFSAIRR